MDFRLDVVGTEFVDQRVDLNVHGSGIRPISLVDGPGEDIVGLHGRGFLADLDFTGDGLFTNFDLAVRAWIGWGGRKEVLGLAFEVALVVAAVACAAVWRRLAIHRIDEQEGVLLGGFRLGEATLLGAKGSAGLVQRLRIEEHFDLLLSTVELAAEELAVFGELLAFEHHSECATLGTRLGAAALRAGVATHLLLEGGGDRLAGLHALGAAHHGMPIGSCL